MADIDFDKDRIRAQLRLQNGTVFPLGTFLYVDAPQRLANVANTQTPSFSDESTFLQQNLDETITASAGASVYDVIVALLDPLPGIMVLVDSPDVAVGTTTPFVVGSSRYEALKWCASALGCYPPFFDNLNRLRFKTTLLSTDTSSDHSYPSGVRILDDTTELKGSGYLVPNRYIVVNGDAQNPVGGIYDLPDSAPHSFAQRGRRIVAPIDTVSSILSPEAAVQQAYIDALTDPAAFGTITFNATADPRHDGYDVMTVLGTRYLETSWSLVCANGGAHTHAGTTLWQA
jgi:hypothetical protein